MSAIGLMNDVCTVYERADVYNPATNGYTPNIAAVATGVPCSIQSAGPSETRMDGADRGIRRVNFYVPIGTEVTANSYVIATTGTYAGVNFTVTSAPIDDAGRGEYLRFSAEQYQGFTKP